MSESPQNNPKQISMESIVSAFTGEPFVQLHWGELHAQMTPDEARQHAFAILECAEAADSDAFLFHFARKRVGMDEERAAKLIFSFREFRGEQPPSADIPESEQ